MRVNGLKVVQSYLTLDLFSHLGGVNLPSFKFSHLAMHVCITFVFFLSFQAYIDSVILTASSSFVHDLQQFLEPVISDNKTSNWTRCYHALSHGWNTTQFHSRCDNKGPTVTIAQVGEYVFGAYISVSWTSK